MMKKCEVEAGVKAGVKAGFEAGVMSENSTTSTVPLKKEFLDQFLMGAFDANAAKNTVDATANLHRSAPDYDHNTIKPTSGLNSAAYQFDVNKLTTTPLWEPVEGYWNIEYTDDGDWAVVSVVDRDDESKKDDVIEYVQPLARKK